MARYKMQYVRILCCQMGGNKEQPYKAFCHAVLLGSLGYIYMYIQIYTNIHHLYVDARSE